jgi:probable HAF family extracellular repeat protein
MKIITRNIARFSGMAATVSALIASSVVMASASYSMTETAYNPPTAQIFYNSAGQIALTMLIGIGSDYHAALINLNNAVSPVTDLGTLGGDLSHAGGINGIGQVVGWADIVGDIQHAALFSDGNVSDLNSLVSAVNGWNGTLSNAYFDTKGQIVAVAEIGGNEHAYLLTPQTAALASSTPIPAAAWLLGPGLIGLAGFRKRT